MLSWGGGILVYRTYALYQEDKEYNVIKGIIPDFGYDVKLAVVVDNKKQNNVPERGLYKTNVSCNNNATGEWDYNVWNLKLDNVSEGTKCNLEFTTNGISEEEYQKQLRIGTEYRRNTYREKDITELYTNGDLFEQIKNCTFGDIYVGDYFTTNKQAPNGTNHKVTWLIADLNNYLHTGITELTTCHATIIPAEPLENALMNDTATTGVVDSDLKLTDKENRTRTNVGAYVGSKMKQKTLPNILKEYITPAFNGHIISYTSLLADQMDPNRYNQYGSDNIKGASSSWAWYESQLDLMSEVNVYGTTTWSSSGYDIGIDNRQYAIFELKPEFINSYGNKRFNYWLKTVAYSTSFALVNNDSVAYANGASSSYGVRPRFLIN